MEQDQRLTPLPKGVSLNPAVPTNYPPTYSSYFDDESLEGKISIRQYLNVVYKRLPLILALAILVTAAAAFYMYRQPDVYSSTAQIIIEPRRPKVTSKDSININFGGDANYLQTQLQLLQGPDLKKAAIVDLGLHRQSGILDNDGRGIGDVLRSIFASEKKPDSDAGTLPVVGDTGSTTDSNPPASLSAEEDAKAAAIANKFAVSVDQVERTNIVNLVVRSEYQDLAPKVALAMAKVFRKTDADREMSGARKAVEDLEKSIEELRNTINEQDLQMIAAMKDQDLSLADKGQEISASRLSTMSATYLKAMEERRNLEGRYNTALAANARGEGASIPEIRDHPGYQAAVQQANERKAKLQDDLRTLDKNIQGAETERAELLVRYTEEFPEVKKLDERISSLKASRASMEKEVSELIESQKKSVDKDAVSGALVSLKAQLDSKRREEAQALGAYEQEYAKANVQGQALTNLTTLRRNIETNRTLLDTYIQRQKEQELAIANTEPDNIKVPGEASGAVKVGPQRGRNILLALLLSLVAGVGLAFLLDYLDDSVKTSDDISRHLGLPTLALIPHYSVGSNRKLLAAGNGAGGSPANTLITLEDRQSPMAEAYRHLRTSLLFSSAGKPPQSILVTSSQPSEGKTTTAVNTAITLAQSDADVVIIDCDLRRPRLHNYFDLENTKGLTNYLSGERNTDNLIKQCRDLPRLKVITSGPIPPNPTELLSSNEMRNLLQFLRGRYKHVVIDSPPAISFTDAAILSTQVDGVVLVAMANKSSIHLMRRFKQRLGTIGARIYGVVLNGLKSGSIEYDYYGTGYYDYYRSADDDKSTPVMESAATNGKG